MGGGPYDALEVEAPEAYQVIQRDGDNLADITIRGFVRRQGTYTLEASFNGGAYADIVAEQSWPDSFEGTLSGQAAGQGTLTVRLKGTSYTDTVEYIGIGDVFMIAGQSNAVGCYTNAQSYSHATRKAGLFANSYQWKELIDHTDDATDAVDAISADVPSYAGSVWPVLATLYLADMGGIPCAFVPCAAGGTFVANWVPGADHLNRNTLYGSMNYKSLVIGGCKAVLWHQGESDALNDFGEFYNASLDLLANGIGADMGVPLLATVLQQFPGATTEAIAAVNAAITEAIGDNANVVAGPDLSDLDTTPDSFHFKSNEQAAIVAGRWWTAIKAAFGW